MSELRAALRETIVGLLPQVPQWLPPALVEMGGGDEDRLRPETSEKHLRWMLERCLENVDQWPIDKTSRWIGYVQGVLAAKSPTFSVDAERDRTRPIFHKAYAALGLQSPQSQSGPEIDTTDERR